MAPKENHLHQPLVDGPDDSDDEWGLPQHGEPRRRCRHDDRAWYRKHPVTILFLISILLAAWAGTFIPLGLNSKCATHTSQWCKQSLANSALQGIVSSLTDGSAYSRGCFDQIRGEDVQWLLHGREHIPTARIGRSRQGLGRPRGGL